jgi:hypothetical protein
LPKVAPIVLQFSALFPLFIFKISYFMFQFLSRTVKKLLTILCILFENL